MTVEELRHRMSHKEWVWWQVYLGRKAQRQEMAAKKAKRRGRRR